MLWKCHGRFPPPPFNTAPQWPAVPHHTGAKQRRGFVLALPQICKSPSTKNLKTSRGFPELLLFWLLQAGLYLSAPGASVLQALFGVLLLAFPILFINTVVIVSLLLNNFNSPYYFSKEEQWFLPPASIRWSEMSSWGLFAFPDLQWPSMWNMFGICYQQLGATRPILASLSESTHAICTHAFINQNEGYQNQKGFSCVVSCPGNGIASGVVQPFVRLMEWFWF